MRVGWNSVRALQPGDTDSKHSYVKYGFHFADFYENHDPSMYS